jgi:hypothetical protein
MFEPHNFVYHYTSSNTLTEKILPSMTLRMGSFQQLNDPREAKTWPFKFYSRAPTGNRLFAATLFDQATKNITERTLVLCCTRDDPQLDKDTLDSATRSGFGHPRMWAQYADRHQGVCLVFDMQLLHETITDEFGGEDLFWGPVQYLNTPARLNSHLPRGGYDLLYLEDYVEYGLAKVMETHIRLFNRELFFTKHLDWRDEWEYRWVLRRNDSSPVFIPIRSCLRAVILGHDCSEAVSEKIIEQCRTINVPVHRAHWQGWTLSLLPNALDDDYHKGPVVVLDGISFSTEVPCGGVFVQGRDQYGNVRPIRIDNNGDVIPLA